ncbi:hypothetical protein [Humidesulfovibrio idahonensis]
MSVTISSKKRHSQLLRDAAMLRAPQYARVSADASEIRSCITCGKIIPAAGLCDECQIIFKLGMAYVAEHVVGKSLEAGDQNVAALSGMTGERSF